MHRRLLICAALVFTAVAHSSSSLEQREVIPSAAYCRHDEAERPDDRARREAAVVLAKAIHAQQGGLAQRTRRYHPLTALGRLPAVPAGFELRLYHDVTGYVFSLKDTLDSCRFAIFSDESGLLYEKSARNAPIVATD